MPIVGVLRRHILLALMFLGGTIGRTRSGGIGLVHGYCAGPWGRWFVGTLLGVVKLRDNRPRMTSSPGYVIEEPHIRVIVSATLASLLSMFALVSGYHCFVALS
jgi:hypothetical protein